METSSESALCAPLLLKKKMFATFLFECLYLNCSASTELLLILSLKGIQIILVVFIVWMICFNGACCLLCNSLLQVAPTLNCISLYLKIIFLSNLKQHSAIPTMPLIFKTTDSWAALSVFQCKPHHMCFFILCLL